MVDLDVFDQIYHTMNESKVVLTIVFVPLIMFALLILLEGFKKWILGLYDAGLSLRWNVILKVNLIVDVPS